MVASDLSPSPAIATTVPSPNVSCDTRSPTANCIAVLFFPVARGGAEVTLGFRVSDGESDEVDPPWFLHSITPSGISSKNREAGLYVGDPHEDLYSAREIYSRFSARVSPTYARRRSSSISYF